jgi:uncharacterized protein (DUF433 family)
MLTKELNNRIVINSKIMVGKPVIRGTRLTVQYILNLLANGYAIEDILKEYNDLSKEDILACLHYASESIDNISYVPLVEAV